MLNMESHLMNQYPNTFYGDISKFGKILGICMFLIYFFLTPDLLESILGININPTIFTVSYLLIFLVILLIILRNVYWESLKNIKINFVDNLKWFILCFILMICLLLIVNSLIAWLNSYFNITTSNLSTFNTKTPLVLIYTIILAPIIEESLFRGLIFRILYSKSVIGAYIISSVLFGFLHTIQFLMVGQISQIFYTLIYITMGLIFAIVYGKTKNMCFNTAFHMFNNILAMSFI